MRKSHPVAIVRVEKASSDMWRVVERETTQHGLKAGEAKVLLICTYPEGAKKCLEILRANI